MKNKRTLKNVAVSVLLVLLLAGCAATLFYAHKEAAATLGTGTSMQAPGDSAGAPGGNTQNGGNGQSSDTQNSAPSGGQSGDNQNSAQGSDNQNADDQSGNAQGNTPPAKPSDDQNSSQSSTQSGSDAQSGNTQNNAQSGGSQNAAPGGQSGSAGESQNGSAPSAPPQGDSSGAPSMPGSGSRLSAVYYVLFALLSLGVSACVLYLILSRGSKYSLRQTFKNSDKVLIFVLATLLLATALTGGQSYAANRLAAGSAATQTTESSAAATGALTADGKTLSVTEDAQADGTDESVLLVSDGGSATVDGATLSKTGGDSSSTENSEFNGVNAGVLVQKNSTATIKNATITTAAKGSNAVFATGEGASINISHSKITTTGSGSARGLDVTYGGSITANDVTVETAGASCAALATDRGEGTVTVTDSTLKTAGAGSPVIYSTGDISITNTTGTATGAQMTVVEGKNSATVTDSTLSAAGTGNRGTVDACGVMLYQSMSGDAGEGTAKFTAKNSTLSITKDGGSYKTAPMFFVTNTTAQIDLQNTKLQFGSGVLLSVKGTSEWGNSGSNGGTVTLNATRQTLTGTMEADSLSALTVNLKNSTYTGAINTAKTAKSVALTLDADSTFTLTADTYVTSLTDSDSTYSNIDLNGHTLYVNGKALQK